MKSLEAIALEYGRNKTPKVTAKGQNELAQRILAEAQSKGFTLRRTLSCWLC